MARISEGIGTMIPSFILVGTHFSGRRKIRTSPKNNFILLNFYKEIAGALFNFADKFKRNIYVKNTYLRRTSIISCRFARGALRLGAQSARQRELALGGFARPLRHHATFYGRKK